MEFEGVVYKIMPVTRGTSARGEWQRQDVVFDYNDGGQFSRKICVTFFNKESDVAKLREGETFLVRRNIFDWPSAPEWDRPRRLAPDLNARYE